MERNLALHPLNPGAEHFFYPGTAPRVASTRLHGTPLEMRQMGQNQAARGLTVWNPPGWPRLYPCGYANGVGATGWPTWKTGLNYLRMPRRVFLVDSDWEPSSLWSRPHAGTSLPHPGRQFPLCVSTSPTGGNSFVRSASAAVQQQAPGDLSNAGRCRKPFLLSALPHPIPGRIGDLWR
jgi:hypothetical protein